MTRKSNRGALAISKLWKWFTADFLGIFKEMRWSYIPPLMVYLAAGVSGFTGIIESFFIKDTLGLSAAFLAGLAFWAGLPWALKMPIGHLVDLFWRRRVCIPSHADFWAQVAMVPMLAWIAREAPKNQKATYFRRNRNLRF